MEFTSKRREMIVPSPPSPPQVVTLSSLDRVVPPLYVSTLFFFYPPSTPPPSEALTLSLAPTLAAFPTMAGRLKPRSNGAGMDVECNNQGAQFVEAHTTVTLDDLLTTGNGDVRRRMYEPSPLWSSLIPNPHDEEGDDPLWSSLFPDPDDDKEGDLTADKPLLLVQLTRLACGGLVLGMLMHHLVVDGTAAMHFKASWTELARGQPIIAHPHLDRTTIQARAFPHPKFEHKEYPIHNSGAKLHGATRTSQCPPIATRVFEFRKEEIQALRGRADADCGGEPCTAFQALAAHIWKHVTRARALAASHPIKLAWPVNGRDRFRPPLPAKFFGNAIFRACVEASAGEVVTLPVGIIAAHIRHATRAVTDEYMRSALGLMAGPMRVSFDLPSPVDLRITSWAPIADFHKMDWGWGAPCFFTRLIPPSPAIICGGKVVLITHPTSHTINAHIVLSQPIIDALLLDTEFHPM